MPSFFLVVLTSIFLSTVAPEFTKLPARAREHLPLLKAEVKDYWSEMTGFVSVFASQIEQESCISLRHRKCWNPNFEVKMEREHAIGLGQLTITKKFNNFELAKKLHPTLALWKWQDRFNTKFQLRAMIFMDKACRKAAQKLAPLLEQLAGMFACYNGGLSGLLSDIVICEHTVGCDTTKWFAHVEMTSNKSRTRVKEYGNRSFFEINRQYPKNILYNRITKYAIELDERLPWCINLIFSEEWGLRCSSIDTDPARAQGERVA